MNIIIENNRQSSHNTPTWILHPIWQTFLNTNWVESNGSATVPRCPPSHSKRCTAMHQPPVWGRMKQVLWEQREEIRNSHWHRRIWVNFFYLRYFIVWSHMRVHSCALSSRGLAGASLGLSLPFVHIIPIPPKIAWDRFLLLPVACLEPAPHRVSTKGPPHPRAPYTQDSRILLGRVQS